MAFDAQKTILLEKQYLYVRASKGFELEGVSTERIWTNTGYYRFLVENVAFTLGNSYVTIHYDSSDVDFIAYCSDLFMEELQNSIVVAVENIQTYLEQFADTNHEDITNLGEGVSGALELIYKSVNMPLSEFDVVLITDNNNYVYLGDDFVDMEVGDEKKVLVLSSRSFNDAPVGYSSLAPSFVKLNCRSANLYKAFLIMGQFGTTYVNFASTSALELLCFNGGRFIFRRLS